MKATAVKPFVPAVLLGLVAAALCFHEIAARLPLHLWQSALAHPDLTDPRQLIAIYSLLPRAALAILAGAALALAGNVFQRVMRNPLAEPATLGTSAGAYLALTIGTLLAPGMVGAGREVLALAGGLVSTLLVFLLALRRGLAPGPLVLAGLLMTFTCGSLTSVLLLYANPYDLSLYLWGAGSLSQNDWSAVAALAPRFLGCCVAIALMTRWLTILGMDDTTAKGIGLRIVLTRLLCLGVAVYLSVSVVCQTGVIGFVGLIAPAIARFAGARTLARQLVSSTLTGAASLWLTDQLTTLAAIGGREWLPAGSATALVGTPVLLFILLRAQITADPPRHTRPASRKTTHPRLKLGCLAGLLMFSALVALDVGNGVHGWTWARPDQLGDLIAWRLPRMTGAAAAGAMLAMAGVILQRLTGNDMASPEVLGLGGGASLALTVVLVISPAAGLGMQIGAMVVGALAMVAALLALERHARLNPDRLLIGGIALAALANVLVVTALSTGLPALGRLKVWMAGATDQLSATQATIGLLCALVFAFTSPLYRRWLDILPLGHASAQAIGAHPRRAQLLLILIAAGMAAAATLLIGPLAFIGLMAPRLAALLGFRQPNFHIMASASVGAFIMIVADWLGRSLLFPYEIPAGLMTALIATPSFLWLLGRRTA